MPLTPNELDCAAKEIPAKRRSPTNHRNHNCADFNETTAQLQEKSDTRNGGLKTTSRFRVISEISGKA
jgi:hypothetical protein